MSLSYLPASLAALCQNFTIWLDKPSGQRWHSLLWGILLATGRRTATSWFRATDITDFRPAYHTIFAVGCKHDHLAITTFQAVKPNLQDARTLRSTFDDTPTMRYGPHVQEAGFHRNPTPAPTGAKYCYGHNWLLCTVLADHPDWGTIAFGLTADLYVRRQILVKLSKDYPWTFATKLQMAGERLRWLKHLAGKDFSEIISIVDGAFAKRPYAKVTKRVKSFQATWHPAGGKILVVLVQEEHNWIPFFSTNPQAEVAEVLKGQSDRWACEQVNKNVKEVEGAGQQQLRNVYANIGALNMNLWLNTMVEVWAWDKPEFQLVDRSASPWDNKPRRPSHADKREALQQELLQEEFEAVLGAEVNPGEIRALVERLVRRLAG